MRVSLDLCTTIDTYLSRNHLECDRNTQDLPSDITNFVELYDGPRSVGLTEVFMEWDPAIEVLLSVSIDHATILRL